MEKDFYWGTLRGKNLLKFSVSFFWKSEIITVSTNKGRIEETFTLFKRWLSIDQYGFDAIKGSFNFSFILTVFFSLASRERFVQSLLI